MSPILGRVETPPGSPFNQASPTSRVCPSHPPGAPGIGRPFVFATARQDFARWRVLAWSRGAAEVTSHGRQPVGTDGHTDPSPSGATEAPDATFRRPSGAPNMSPPGHHGLAPVAKHPGPSGAATTAGPSPDVRRTEGLRPWLPGSVAPRLWGGSTLCANPRSSPGTQGQRRVSTVRTADIRPMLSWLSRAAMSGSPPMPFSRPYGTKTFFRCPLPQR